MDLVKDLGKIEQLALQREDENWDFRCYLKASDLSSSKIDSVVHRLYQEVSAQIDCTQCANCCKTIPITLTEADIQRLARLQGIPADEFQSRYLKNEEGEEFELKEQPCPFLSDNRCTVYDSRPEACRSYPHLHKRDFVARLNQAVFNCSACPIVFNVYEGAKKELWRRRRK